MKHLLKTINILLCNLKKGQRYTHSSGKPASMKTSRRESRTCWTVRGITKNEEMRSLWWDYARLKKERNTVLQTEHAAQLWLNLFKRISRYTNKKDF